MLTISVCQFKRPVLTLKALLAFSQKVGRPKSMFLVTFSKDKVKFECIFPNRGLSLGRLDALLAKTPGPSLVWSSGQGSGQDTS